MDLGRERVWRTGDVHDGMGLGRKKQREETSRDREESDRIIVGIGKARDAHTHTHLLTRSKVGWARPGTRVRLLLYQCPQ
jgi:hypothetical protein